ncbi:hypothetical protein P691DRAFT_793972 [Macrolepiota fuliginosa MF-IS2]|uniref:Extracellular metalloproteinase n=1 Tax=Macrolepiota fuliginosa MF-IS2 TaxID=1400762 RepID=A0A9P6C300_9AGAR|nr:hypothetical protein P691DRAFT_793972 [Macrolepiota fuliginosa MF-IS2]
MWCKNKRFHMAVVSTRSSGDNHNAVHYVPLETYHPPTTYETYGQEIEHAAFDSAHNLDLADKALSVDVESVPFRSGYTSEAGEFVYPERYHEGIPFINSVANVAWKDDKVVSFGSSFVTPKNSAKSTPSITVEIIISTVEAALDGKYNEHPTSLEYLARDNGTVSLVHVTQVQNSEVNFWYEAYVYVDAHTGELISLTDFVAEAMDTVLLITKRSIPEGIETLTDPADLMVSPYGRHAPSTTNYTTTSGNNVVAYKASSTNCDTTQAPSTTINVNVARINIFYVTTYNLQTDNSGKGGAEGDRVLMSVQDSSGTNNVNFATPPEYIWTYTTPNHDGSLQNDIPIHESTHGTNRMTGGGTGRCFQTTEAGGLGEGWSDAMSELTIEGFVLGEYVVDDPAGLRTYPYPNSAATNPWRYSSLKPLDEVHSIGEVWANILHQVYSALVTEYGFDADARTNPASTGGNTVYPHLFLDALAIQPCSPTFVTIRAAWILADQNWYGAFASCDLGINAASYTDDTTVPSGC